MDTDFLDSRFLKYIAQPYLEILHIELDIGSITGAPQLVQSITEPGKFIKQHRH